MLNKHKRWFHSSRVKFPLVSMSASWFLVSMYLIWILGSKLTRSNNQSRATLWVLETCLMVGLLPFMIILITASLSSNTYNKASWREDWMFEGIKSTLSKSLITLWDCLRLRIVWGGEQASRLFTTGLSVLSWFWVVFPRTETIRSHRSKAGIPSNLNPASNEMISGSVELCETEVCFLHIQFIGTNVGLPKMHNVPPEVDFESSRSLVKSESWNSPNLLVWQCFPHDNFVCIHMCDECKRSNEIIICHRLWSILWSIVQVYSLTIEYQVFQYVPSISISEQFESILVTILPQISFLPLQSGGHRCME